MTDTDKKNRIFGIDLGTTYSCIAYVNDAGKTEVVPNSDGDLTTPSVVYFEDARNVVVGNTAKEELKTTPERVISLVKRAACETPGAGGLAQSSILLVNTHSPWIADWMPAPEDRRHAERWK